MPMTIRRIVDALEALAPLAYQEDYDNAGLQVGLINYTEMMTGLQIGLINIITESVVPFFPIINFCF